MAAAALPCKLIAQVAFKAGGDVFHHLVANKPLHLTKATPSKIRACHLHQGNYGINGTIIEWEYAVDGVWQTAKQSLQDIDSKKQQIAWKMLEGDLTELYKDMLITAHVETKGKVDFITWTIDYELLKPDNPHPIRLLNFFIEITNEIESHIFG